MPQKSANNFRYDGKAGISRQSNVEAVINLLHDDRDLEARKDYVEDHIRNIAARGLRVALHQLVPRHAAAIGGRPPAQFLQVLRVARLHPIGQSSSQVAERVAERAHLPIQDANDFGEVLRMENDIVKLVVVVNERGVTRRRHVLLHPRRDSIDLGEIVSFRSVVAFYPAANLTLEIALGLAEIGEADRSVIDAVEMRKIVDK